MALDDSHQLSSYACHHTIPQNCQFSPVFTPYHRSDSQASMRPEDCFSILLESSLNKLDFKNFKRCESGLSGQTQVGPKSDHDMSNSSIDVIDQYLACKVRREDEFEEEPCCLLGSGVYHHCSTDGSVIDHLLRCGTDHTDEFLSDQSFTPNGQENKDSLQAIVNYNID